jgi:hypothetical protein
VPPPKLPRPIVELEAQRAMRMHHMLWHTARNGWNRFPDDVRAAFENIGWKPPRPALDEQGAVIVDNDSGEDFLFMHRQMIKAVNQKLAEIHDPDYPKVEGWTTFPAPGDPDYPVPPAYSLGSPSADASLQKVKSDDFFNDTFRVQERQFEDPDFLRSLSLAALGARVEFSVHNAAHMRWSAKPAEFRPSPPADQPQAVDARFDDPSYDWLGDFYASHVNSVFWKLHGWVDERIDAWAAANGVVGEVSFHGTWVGPPHMHDMHGMHDMLAVAREGEAVPELDEHAARSEELLTLAGAAGLEASPLDAIEL